MHDILVGFIQFPSQPAILIRFFPPFPASWISSVVMVHDIPLTPPVQHIVCHSLSSGQLVLRLHLGIAVCNRMTRAS